MVMYAIVYVAPMDQRKKATLVVHQKLTSSTGLLREISIWRTPKSERYPEGVRYRLVLVDPQSGHVLLLFDNHWPKGNHVHIGKHEYTFEFNSVPDLILAFRLRSEQEEMRYHENEKN
jgi:hypothetical protein